MANQSYIDEWIQSTIDRSHQTTALKRLYDLQSVFLFNQYEPVKASAEDSAATFAHRIDRWLSCFKSAEDKWAAYHSLKYFFFVGQLETEEMYRCAVHEKLLPWLTDLNALDIFSDDFESTLDEEIKRSWICPATDSLRINSLLHRTGLQGKSLRPDWLSLRELGSAEKIAQYVEKKQIKYLAVFEDFVGGGSQSSGAMKYALEVFPGPILFVPLVICQPGHKLLSDLASQHTAKLSYQPVVVIGAECLIADTPNSGEPLSFKDLRIAMQNGYATMGLQLDGGGYGYGGVGSLVTSYSNCPNNTPPIYHASSSTWPHAIFPRQTRA
jgi:hypothetical protein